MNHLNEQLAALKLTGFREALKNQLMQTGTYHELGFEERLSLLAAEELTSRENRKAGRLIAQESSDSAQNCQNWITAATGASKKPISAH